MVNTSSSGGDARTRTVQYIGYALQLLLVLVLVISLACKSWALLGVCTGAAVVLLALVCIQMITNARQQQQQQQNYNNIHLMKKRHAGPSSSSSSSYTTPAATMTSFNHPDYTNYEYPEWADHLQFAPPSSSSSYSDHHQQQQQQSTAPPIYTPTPIYAAHMQNRHVDEMGQVAPLTSSEKAALQIMTMTDRVGEMQAPAISNFDQRIVPISMGMDEHAHLNGYQVPVQKQQQQNQLPVHMDPFHPNNPMNSFSYLYQY